MLTFYANKYNYLKGSDAMQEFAHLVAITRIPGSLSLKQSVKGNRRPRNAVSGGNGSYNVYERAQVILTVKYNSSYYSTDIYYTLKHISSRKRITDKFCYEIEYNLRDFKFIVKNGNKIVNLTEAIEYAIKT